MDFSSHEVISETNLRAHQEFSILLQDCCRKTKVEEEIRRFSDPKRRKGTRSGKLKKKGAADGSMDAQTHPAWYLWWKRRSLVHQGKTQDTYQILMGARAITTNYVIVQSSKATNKMSMLLSIKTYLEAQRELYLEMIKEDLLLEGIGR